jgi:hypothetical protein
MHSPARLFLFLLICIRVGGSARADDYAWELSGLASQADLDPQLDTDLSTITATYHFAGVDDAKGPFELASFLDPETRIAASVAHERQALHAISAPGLPTLPDVVTESDTYSVSGRYVLPAKKWYAGGRYVQSDPETAVSSLLTDAEIHGATIFAGRYLGAATTLDLTLDRAVTDTRGTGIACVVNLYCAAIVPQTTHQTRDTVSLGVVHMRRFRSLTYTLSGSIADSSGQVVIHSGSFELPVPSPLLPPGVVFGPLPSVTVPARTTELGLDRFLVYSVAGELFPTSKLGVRLGYAHWDDSNSLPYGYNDFNSPEYGYEVAATWFVSRNVGLRFMLGRQHVHSFTESRDTDVASVQATGRF